MGDFEASAKAEANVVKVNDISANADFNIINNISIPTTDASKPSLLARVISQARQAVNPIQFASEVAIARRIKTESDITVYDVYRQNMPWLTDQQAFLLANGYTSTPDQACNVFSVFELAEEELQNQEAPKPLEPVILDGIIEGAKLAYDAELRKMWVALLSSAERKPGEVSRRTLAILSAMGKEEALVFEKICSFVAFDENSGPGILILMEDDRNGTTYNNGAILYSELCMLESLGLFTISAGYYPNITYCNGLTLKTSDKTIKISTEAEDRTFSIRNGALTEYGCELAKACSIRSSFILDDLIKRKAEAQGFVVDITKRI